MRENRARKSLVDRAVERLAQGLLATLAEIFANTVKDDDRVVEGISNHCKQRRDNCERHLKVHDLEERDRRKEIVSGCDDCREAEAPLEPDRKIDQSDGERDQHRDESAALELFADFRSDGFAADDAHILRAKLVQQD